MNRILNFLFTNYALGTKIKTNTAYLIFLIIYWEFVGKKETKLRLNFRNKAFFFCVNNRMDLVVLSEIFVNEEYNFEYSGSPEIIVDLGANIGDTAIFYSILFPEAQIYAVEPNPQVHEKLDYNTSQFQNIKVCKYAISDTTGRINLNFGDSHLGSSINVRKQNKNSVEVDVFSLEDFCRRENIEKIDILKFDIEGAEEYLLKSSFLKTNVVQLVGEMHDDLVSSPLEPMIEGLNLKNTSLIRLNKKRYILYGTL